MSYFDNIFAREFKAVMGQVKSTNPLPVLPPTDELAMPFTDVVSGFARLSGIPSSCILGQIGDALVFLPDVRLIAPADVTFSFHWSAKDTPKPFSVPSGYRLVACRQLIQVPNAPLYDETAYYVGLFKRENALGQDMAQLWAVREDYLVSEPAFAVSITSNRVSKHLGALRVMSPVGHWLNIVVQEHFGVRRTSSKSVYHVTPSHEDAVAMLYTFYTELVSRNLAFGKDFFEVQLEQDFAVQDANLVFEEFDASVEVEQVAGLPLSES